MKVLIIGGGGREHAIAWKLNQSPKVTALLCAPGNAGISKIAECYPNIKATDIEGIVRLCKTESVDFAVVAPDDPLALGCVDSLEAAGIPAFGPTKAAARFEYSKKFSKDFMKKYHIPTAAYETFSRESPAEAISYIKSKNTYPAVIKADGLAVGKGVIIAENEHEAIEAINSILVSGKFGKSGDRIVIEEYMEGTEASILCFVDGNIMAPMPSSQDHKRALDDDMGLNTGGMGAFSPSAAYTHEMAERTKREILAPTLEGMKQEGITFKGVLYVGIMLTKTGPKVVEYNARFGDPEAQAVLPLLNGDLMEIFMAIREGRLSEVKYSWRADASCCVVLASGGYPEKFETGFPISGIEAANETGTIVFHAATRENDGKTVTSGGRVLGITAIASSLDGAIEKAYSAAALVGFEKMHYRRDIGKKR